MPSDSSNPWPDDALVEAVRQAAEELGHPPTMAEYKETGRLPSAQTISSRIGWVEALDRAGYDGDVVLQRGGRPQEYDETDVCEAIQRVAQEIGEENLTVRAYERHRKSHEPSAGVAQYQFADWSAAVQEVLEDDD